MFSAESGQVYSKLIRPYKKLTAATSDGANFHKVFEGSQKNSFYKKTEQVLSSIYPRKVVSSN